jgi:hypothetical protein
MTVGRSGEKTVTDAKWLTCNDPQPMLILLRGKASERKLRLFEVACCRSIWHLLTDERSRKLVEVAEQCADGHPKPRGPLESAAMEAVSRFPTNTAWFAAAKAAVHTIWDYPPDSPYLNSSYPPMVRDALAVAGNAAEAVPSEPPVQTALLRDIFGNPFRPIVFDPAWLTWHDGLLVSMAWQMYDSRDFADMPVLADALEEAGCSDQDILAHCRSGGEHVRGCWVVDLILGKE